MFYICVRHSLAAPSGFTAHPSADITYADGDIIEFDVAISNIGEDYDTETSSYTCPNNGVYVFAVTVTPYSSDTIQANVVHEGNILTSAVSYAYSSGATYYNQGSSMAVMECSTGEKVWVECAFSSGNVLESGGDPVYSSFSGFLLQAY